MSIRRSLSFFWPALSFLCVPVAAQTTVQASVSTGGALGNGPSYSAVISADGRCVLFTSQATNLAPGDPDSMEDVYLRDLVNGTTEMISVNSSGQHATRRSLANSLSADARFASFESIAGNLMPGDTDNDNDIFVRDRLTGTTIPASVSTGGAPGNADSEVSVLSGDGRYVAFRSLASNLVAGDTNNEWDVFVHDLATGVTERVNLGPGGAEAHGSSYVTSMSFDGRYVLFSSLASDLVPNDTNNERDIFVRDRLLGITTRVSVDSFGVETNGDSHARFISADGRFATYSSLGDNLVPNDVNGVQDIFVHELATGITTLASLSSTGAEADQSVWSNGISSDGRFVTLESTATNLVPGDAGFSDVFVRDRWTGTTTRVSLASNGAALDRDAFGGAISADGRRITFQTDAHTVVPANPGGQTDVYVRDRGPSSSFSSLCAGDSALACPCGNAGGTGRGCQNSGSTGGALLTAAGNASLASDSVQFTSSGEMPSALSIVLQGDAWIAPVHFGDGIRCAGGSLKRLFTGNAIGGVFTAPQGTDPTVSARSSTLGDPIPLGASRVYHVYYRDPNASFCPAPQGGTFNSSNAIAIAWGT
jgi:Tol biopolymer transport system component